MFAVSNAELQAAPGIGKTLKCHMCGKRHKVRYGDKIREDGVRVPSKLLAYYKCGNASYICAIDGKEVLTGVERCQRLN